MRNLKRALSLTLASVMLLGMMIVGTSAVSFNDADDITNVTAATILQDLEIMVGDGENFMPNQVVTRGQMAIIVCKILYGDKLNVSQFSDATQYTDVAVGDYFNGYVNLATSLGIISGYGNGQFGPGDPVTTAQAALMLTKALGYFKGGELKGDWAVDSLAAITKATDLKMFADMKAPASNEGLTRDNVANMVFNTITKAVTVEYNANFDIYFNTGAAWANGVIFRYDDTLGFQRFDLVYKTKADGLGRPQTRWGVGSVNKTSGYLDNYGNLVSSQVIIADRDAIVDVNNTPLATYNTKLVTDANYDGDFKYTGGATSTPSSTSLTTIKNDLDGYLVGAQTSDGYTTLHINGGTQSMKYANIPAAAQDIASRGIGDGVQIYVYANNSSEITDIVVVEQQLAKVTAVNDKKQTITLALSGDHQGNNESSAIIDSTSSLYGKLTDAKVAVGDYLLVVMNGKTVKTADIPETVTGVVKAYTNRGALTMDGTKYNASISKIKVATETNDLADPREYEDTTSTAILYLDACGNVVAVKGDIDSKIVYVGRTDGEDGFSSVLKAYVFFADGGKGVYTVASYNGSTDSEDINLVKEGLYLYSANGQEISLKDMGGGNGTSALNSSVWFISTKPNDADGANNSVSLNIKGNTTGYTVGGKTVYVDKNTVFFTHKIGTDGTPEVPSDAVKTDFINVSTGLKSLDDTLDGSYTALSNASVLCKIVDGKYLALAVYGENAQNVAAASNDLVYVSDSNWSTENSSTYSSDAVFTGDKEAQNIKFKGQNKIGLYTYTEKDGVYDLKLATPDNCAYGNKDGDGNLATNGVKLTKVGNNLDFTSDGSMTPSSLNIDKDVLVFDEDLNVVDTGILSSKECYGHVVVDNTRDKNVIAIYIAKTYDKGEGPANPPSQAPVAVDTPAAIAAKFDVTFSDGSDSKNLQAGNTATLIIKDKAGKTRVAGDNATVFVKNNYYTVTVNGVESTVKCTVDHKLTVTYTVKADDLVVGARKIQVTAIVEADAPVKSTAPSAANVSAKTAEIDTKTGKATVTITGTENWAAGTYKLYVAEGTTAAATFELAEAGKTLTFTDVTGLTKEETSFYLTLTEAEKTESDKSEAIKITPADKVVPTEKSTAPSAANVSAKTAEIDTKTSKATVTISGNADWAVGTYKLYVADGTTAAATVELAKAGKVLTFTDVTGLTKMETSFYLTLTEAEKLESDKSEAIKITPADKVVDAGVKNVLGTIETDSTAANVSIKSIVVKDSKGNEVAADAEMAAGDYTLVVTPNNADKTTAPATVTLSGVTAKGDAVVAGTPSWGSTDATSTVVTIDAGSAVAEANTITYTFTVAAATGSSNTTITPVVTIETEGMNAKLEANVTFTGNPTWAENDTVTFTNTDATPVTIVAEYGSDGTWTCTGAPSGYKATFADGKLTLTAETKTDVADNPFSAFTAAVSNAADSSLKTATVGTAVWTPGVAASAKA